MNIAFRAANDAATEAAELIFECRTTASRLEINNTVRNRTALALLLASIDECWSLCKLVAMNHQAARFPALVLYRGALDKMLRGGFFARAASQDELETFWREQRMPTRQIQGQDDARLTPPRLAMLIDFAYGLPQGRLRQMVENQWGIFSGVVHGGVEVVRMYLDDAHEEIGCRIDDLELLEVVQHSLVFAHLSVRFIRDMANVDRDEFDIANQAVNERIGRFLALNHAYLDAVVARENI